MPFWESDRDDVWRVVETNLRGPLLMTRALLPPMVQRGHGRVVNLASRARAATRSGTYTGYAVSKRAVSLFTESLGVLPEHLYSHASSLLGTTQQVAGAIGTAVVVTVLSWRAAGLSHDGASAAEAAIGGTQWAFITRALLSIGIIVLALVIPSRAPEGMAGQAH